MKNEYSMLDLFFKVAILLSLVATLPLLTSCSDSINTSGVLSETESGKTIAGLVVDGDGKVLARARVLITRVDSLDAHTYAIDSTETDNDGTFLFKNAPKDAYGILAYGASDSLIGFTELGNDTESTTITADKPASLQITLSGDNKGIKEGDLCFDGTLICVTVSTKDLENGFIVIPGLPAGEQDYRISLWQNGKTDLAYLIRMDLIPGKTYYVGSHSESGNVSDSTKIGLSDTSILDSLQAPQTLDSMIVPVILEYRHLENVSREALLDGNGFEVEITRAQAETDTARFWATLASLGKDSLSILHLNCGGWGSPTRIRQLYASTDTGLPLEGKVFSEDSSLAISFWIEADGKESEGRTILSTGSDSLGFKITQCETDAQSICTRIYNGLLPIPTESDIYGKAKILDGKPHHVSFAIHKKHLTIVIDGKAIRSTDLKLAPSFYELEDLKIGDFALNDFVLYSFGDYIRKQGERDWTRLETWLAAFYKMQSK